MKQKIRKFIAKIPFAKKIYHSYLNVKDKILYKNVIRTLVVITGQKCSLHCKHCANFSPYQSKELDFYDAEKIILDLEKITKKKKIYDLQFQGGEFFLHKDAEKLLFYTKNNKKILRISVATNGTIIPNEACLKELDGKKMRVRISDYGETNRKKADRFATRLLENDIKHWYYKFAHGTSFWCDCGGKNFARLSAEEALKNYETCCFRGCLTLENGIVSRCSRATVAHFVQGFEPAKKDFVNVRAKDFKIENLVKYDKLKNVRGGGIVTACFYCNGTNGKSIPAGEQLNIEEIKKINVQKDASTLLGATQNVDLA